jgi:hypothetical protein
MIRMRAICEKLLSNNPALNKIIKMTKVDGYDKTNLGTPALYSRAYGSSPFHWRLRNLKQNIAKRHLKDNTK